MALSPFGPKSSSSSWSRPFFFFPAPSLLGSYPVSPLIVDGQVSRLAVAHLFFSPNLMPKKDTIMIDD